MDKILESIKAEVLLECSAEFVVESYEEVNLSEDEETETQSFLKLTGTFQKGNFPNGNKRIYKTPLLVREVKIFQTKITAGLALGKVYHPGWFDHGGPSGVTDVSHRVIKLWMHDDIVKGELLIFKTVSGIDVTAITEGGGKLGISSRGWGSMKRFDSVTIDGKVFKDVWVVDDSYKLETFDLVLTPSVKTAILKPVKESLSDLDANKFNEAKNLEKSKEDLIETKKGGIKPMTLDELKAQHPALYNTVHEAGVSEGRRVGAIDGKASVTVEHDKAMEVKDKEIKIVKEEVTVLKADKVKLESEKKELADKNVALESDKSKNEIRNAVVEAVNASEFKDHLGEAEIASICNVSPNVEEGKKEVAARIKLIENVIAKHTGKKTTETNSKSTDNSQDNSSNEDKQKQNEDFKKQQRTAAFG